MRLLKSICLVALLIGFGACNSENAEDSKAASSPTMSSTVNTNDLFEEEQKEGCSTEEDLEKKLAEASKEGASLQGSTDCLVE